MRVTPKLARAAYDFLRHCPPFSRWRLPSQIAIRIDRSRKEYGSYNDPNGVHTIVVSAVLVKTFHGLLALMAHEMVHLAQRIARTDDNRTQHNREWIRRARRVCRSLGWDYSQGFK